MTVIIIILDDDDDEFLPLFIYIWVYGRNSKNNTQVGHTIVSFNNNFVFFLFLVVYFSLTVSIIYYFYVFIKQKLI